MISFLLLSANNIALQHKRKTLTATDVLDAIEEMEFTTFLKPLKDALESEFLRHRSILLL